MSSEIFYDKAFIKVPGGYIPVVNHGSSNCFDISWSGREIPEKHWTVLNYPNYGKMVFTADEMAEVAKVYEEANMSNRGGTKKSRYQSFEEGEFGRWILSGMKTAHTVEEYTQCGNTVIILDYSTAVWQKIPVSTTDELLKKLKEYDGRKDFDVSFLYERSVIHPPMRKKGIPFDFSGASEFYVLHAEQGYFVKRSKRRIWTTKDENPNHPMVRKFRSEKAAKKYLDDNARFFSQMPFTVECVRNGGVLT